MAFCTACGSTVDDASAFCTKCGKPLPAVTASAKGAAPVPASAPSHRSGEAMRILVVVVAVVIGLTVISVAVSAFIAYRAMKHARIEVKNGHTTVTTSVGSVETTTDAAKAAQGLGIDLYPGAHLLEEGNTATSVGSMSVVTIQMETEDSPEKVAAFYKPKFPDAMVTTEEEGKHVIISRTPGALVTVNIERTGDKTRIVISRSGKK